MAWREIPLDAHPNQEFNITVDAGDGNNVPLIMHIRYNTEGEFWRMDISDGKTGTMLVSGVPLVTGGRPSANIMKQFEHLGIGGAVILAMTDKTLRDYPSISDLGTDFVLLWGSGAIQ